MVVLNKNKNIVVDFRTQEVLEANCYQKNRTIYDQLFDFCEGCARMAAIPQGAFAACKLRAQNKNELTVARIQTTDKQESKIYSNKKLMEYTPVKYNSKLMNSIWGFYNRYSPHNIKGNDDAPTESVQLQQPMAVAAYVITENLVMATKFGKEWNFPAKRLC